MEKMDSEEYQWNKKELMKHRNLPYMFSNEDLAISFIDMLREEHPTASLHFWKIHQWICLNDRARAKLREDMIEWAGSLSLELSELCANIEGLKKKEAKS